MFKKLLPFLLFFAVSCSKKDEPIAKSSAKSITGFSFNAVNPAVSASIDETAKTITANFPIGTDLTQLIPTITISSLATITPNTGIVQDFTNPISYTVKAEDGSTSIYTTKITRTKSSSQILKSFVFNGLSPAISATIDTTKYTISATLPVGTDLTKLVPTISISPLATISPSTDIAQDFSNPVTYIIKAENGSSTTYTAKIIRTKSSNKNIKSFAFKGLNPAVSAVIDTVNYTITAIVPNATDLTKLLPSITVAPLAIISPATDVTQDFSKLITYTTTAEDGSKQTWIATVSSFVAIPDINFEKALIALGIDDVQDGKILRSKAEKVTELDFYGAKITNLQGLEAFINLKKLNCSTNKVRNLDVSKNINLQELSCGGDELSSLDISKNIALKILDCNGNQLSSLDVSKNINLQKLICYSNSLSGLDVSKNTALLRLEYTYNKITFVDVSKNTLLEYLACDSNPLVKLDVSKNINLNYLYCGYNQLSSIDISKNTNLQYFDCSNNSLKELDLSKNVDLIQLGCIKNSLISLDVSKNTALKYLDCYSNTISTLNVSNNPLLKRILCYFNDLSSLNVTKCTNLTELRCFYNDLSSLDVTKNTSLSILICSTNALTNLDVSKNTALTDLNCNNNNLTSLDVSKIVLLQYLNCSTNKIETICVSSLNQPPKSGWLKDTKTTYSVCK